MISIGTHASQNGGHWVDCFEASVELRVLVARFDIHPLPPLQAWPQGVLASVSGKGGSLLGDSAHWPGDRGRVRHVGGSPDPLST